MASAEANMFDESGRYVMHNFDRTKAMSSFLPGVGGFWGLPMWAFYVNRGQGIAAFGTSNKDGPIMKFECADAAYRTTTLHGFRTLLNLNREGNPPRSYQPFFVDGEGQREMLIGMNEMEIRETNTSAGLATEVLYFMVPNEDFPALVRRVTFQNLGDTHLSINALDGLAKLEPTGIPNANLLTMGRTMEAWKNVYNVEGGDTCRPFFHVSTDPADTAQVKVVEEGHFVVAFMESAEPVHGLLPFVLDPTVAFGTDTTLRYPHGFPHTMAPESLAHGEQCFCARTPCALAAATMSLAPQEKVSLVSVYGHAANLADAIDRIIPKLHVKGYIEQKRQEAASLPTTLTKRAESGTAIKLFDEYVRMSFWDNMLRGGLPYILGNSGNSDTDLPIVYHCFSRIHGDMERDYNNFQLDLTYFSQGPGNYRDVNQNRRLDVFFEPRVRDFNIRQFLSFVQADGYNPLTVATPLFRISTNNLPKVMTMFATTNSEPLAAIRQLLSSPFRPGDLFKQMQQAGCTLAELGVAISRDEFLQAIVQAAEQLPAAKYSQDGFWSDHWTYNLDLVESYLSVYPDKERLLLFDGSPIPFFISPATVQPRAKKYKPQSDGSVIQAQAVADAEDLPFARVQELKRARSHFSYVQDAQGAGNSWHLDTVGQPMLVTVGTKLLMLGAVKFATLDPLGMGVEMEGGKPGWNDAMNGLPGILGSSMPEAYEVLRLLKYLQSVVERFPAGSFEVPPEMDLLLHETEAQLDRYLGTAPTSEVDPQGSGCVPAADFTYWDAVSAARENYCMMLTGAFAGAKTTWSGSAVACLLEKMVAKLQHGAARASNLGKGISPSYFSYVMQLSTDDCSGSCPARPVSCRLPTVYPLFLEGPVRQIRVLETLNEKRALYSRVRESGLYDVKLKMYKVCESLQGQPPSLGRILAFAPGWLENESVWLHMSYKYLLELLRAGMFDDFFEESKAGLVPFMDPACYGRSPLENVSFIASSAFPDKRLHGTGFVARLSGSTVEMLNIWVLMMAGPSPFTVGASKGLELAFRPALPSWLFKDDGTVSFTFLGRTTVTYHNPTRASTWELGAAKQMRYVTLDGSTKTVPGGMLLQADALLARELKLATLDVFY